MKNFDIAEVKEFIRNSSKESAVYVGCDSVRTRKHGKKEAVFATVVVVHLNRSNGARVFGRIEYLPAFPTHRERLLKEVELSIGVATELVDVVGDRPFEVHLDLNPNPDHYSSCVIKEALGWVRGMQLNPVVKPDAFAASCAADYYANGQA